MTACDLPTASPFTRWRRSPGRALEAALNRVLALDPDTARRACARSTAGASRSRSKRRRSPCRSRVDGDRLRVGPVERRREPDLGVRATLGGLIAQLPFFKRDDAPPVGRVRITGDAELARRLQRLAERFDPDWQQPFVAVFGDDRSACRSRKARRRPALRRSAAPASRGARRRRIPHRGIARRRSRKAELHAFRDDVDALRDDVERLAARVARLRGAAGAR